MNGIYKSMESVDLFINSYPDDGSCSEGPGYWAHAGGKLFDYLELLDTNLKGGLNAVFDHELIKNMGRYIYRSYISNGYYYINFADAAFRIKHNPGRIFRYGHRIGDPVMASFGAFLVQQSNYGQEAMVGRIGETLGNLFNLEDGDTAPSEPLIADYYFPDLDAALGRDREGSDNGFYFAAKGGSNGEQHNHNDVGAFMLFFNGTPVFLDVGVGTYTRETFGPDRYSIWTMQSNYHNLPVINGLGQNPGVNYRAVNSEYSSTPKQVTYCTDISQAYPEEAKVNSWVRTYTLERQRKFSVEDNFHLEENNSNTSIHFMTGLPSQIISPGILKMEGENFVLQVKYDPELLDGSIEVIKIEDNRLRQNHGDAIARVVFKRKENGLSGNLSFEITEIDDGQ